MKQFSRKNLLCLFFISTLFLFAEPIEAQLNTPRGSQMATVKQRVGITDIYITYSRPKVNNREIWGKLVPYGMNNLGFGTAKESPWRAGANENTIIKFTNNVTIEGKSLKAGKYGLHMVIHEDGNADIIFSKNHTAWGSYFYNPEEDALKVSVKTEEAPHREFLTFEFVDVQPTETTAALIWEKKQIPFKIGVDVTNIVLADIRRKMQNQQGFSRQNWEQAANYAYLNGNNLEEAMSWINAAREGQFFSQKTFANAQIKAAILRKMGKESEAEKLMDDSMKLGTVFQVHGHGRALITQGKTDRAMKVFKWNASNHKNTWPVNYGLARGYEAKGDKKSALKYLNKALALAPAKVNKDRVQANIDRLKKGEALQ